MPLHNSTNTAVYTKPNKINNYIDLNTVDNNNNDIREKILQEQNQVVEKSNARKTKKVKKRKFSDTLTSGETSEGDLIYENLYGDVIQEEFYEKPSRWRLMYERTGLMNFKFNGGKRLELKAVDIRKSKLKFLDSEKTRLNVNEPTNKLILAYRQKKLESKIKPISLRNDSSPQKVSNQVIKETLPVSRSGKNLPNKIYYKN